MHGACRCGRDRRLGHTPDLAEIGAKAVDFDFHRAGRRQIAFRRQALLSQEATLALTLTTHPALAAASDHPAFSFAWVRRSKVVIW